MCQRLRIVYYKREENGTAANVANKFGIYCRTHSGGRTMAAKQSHTKIFEGTPQSVGDVSKYNVFILFVYILKLYVLI